MSEIAKVADCTVRVVAGDADGAGVVIAHIGSNSYVLTCAHVVEGAKRVRVSYLINGALWRHANGVVERRDDDSDLALIRTAKRIDRATITIADDEPESYDRVLGIGHPADAIYVPFEGVLGLRGGPKSRYYVYSGFSAPGMSGGPFANDDGELIGILAAVGKTGHLLLWSVGYAVTLPRVKRFLGPIGVKSARKLARATKIVSPKPRRIIRRRIKS